MGLRTMERALFAVAAVLVSACGSDSTSPQSLGSIVGSYTLTSVNGQQLPAQVVLPNAGAAVVTGGNGSIGAYSSVSIAISVTYGSPQTSAAINEAGVVTGGGGNYLFTFADGTTATAKCTSSQCSVIYAPNTYVFTRG